MGVAAIIDSLVMRKEMVTFRNRDPYADFGKSDFVNLGNFHSVGYVFGRQVW